MVHPLRKLRRIIIIMLWIAGLAGLALLAWTQMARGPQDMPWTALSLGDPPGLFTTRKLVRLRADADGCRALLDAGGVEYYARPEQGTDECRAVDLVQPRGGAMAVPYAPADVAPSCPVLAGLALWEWHVVQPEAERILGSRVNRIRHLGSYSCRRMYGDAGASWSEHATGNALDIAGFDLADGRRIDVVADWGSDDDEARFLKAVRDGACGLFATVLSPDYNAAHRDHFHFDQAGRGEWGGSVCR